MNFFIGRSEFHIFGRKYPLLVTLKVAWLISWTARLSLYKFRTILLVFLSWNILFINTGFISFSVLKICLFTFIIFFPVRFRIDSYHESWLSCSKQRAPTAQKMKFFIKYFFSKFDQIRWKLLIWSHLLNKSLMKNFIFCAVSILSNNLSRENIHSKGQQSKFE